MRPVLTAIRIRSPRGGDLRQVRRRLFGVRLAAPPGLPGRIGGSLRSQLRSPQGQCNVRWRATCFHRPRYLPGKVGQRPVTRGDIAVGAGRNRRQRRSCTMQPEFDPGSHTARFGNGGLDGFAPRGIERFHGVPVAAANWIQKSKAGESGCMPRSMRGRFGISAAGAAATGVRQAPAADRDGSAGDPQFMWPEVIPGNQESEPAVGPGALLQSAGSSGDSGQSTIRSAPRCERTETWAAAMAGTNVVRLTPRLR